MMKPMLSCQMHHYYDELMRQQYRMNNYQLMDRATDLIMQRLKPWIKDKRSIVVVGPGNNGGDGLALAKKAKANGVTMDVANLNDQMHQSSDAVQLFYRQAKASGVCFKTLPMDWNNYDVIIDALFGSGLNRPVQANYAQVIQSINDSRCKIISMDLPSGMNGDGFDGNTVMIHADITLSIGGYKPVMLNGLARAYCGQIILIPLWPNHYGFEQHPPLVIEKDDLSSFIPSRTTHSHKGSYGKAIVIGGSMQMGGAVILAAKAALRSGVGLCTIMCPNSIANRIGSVLPEVMVKPMDDENGWIKGELDPSLLKDYDVIAFGNGIGVSKTSSQWLKTLLTMDKPLIIDGDGLNVLQDHFDALTNRKADTILLPHVKEMQRLTPFTMDEITKDPFKVLAWFDQHYPNVHVLLKDDWMMTIDHHHHFIFPLGNNCLAKGGSGDTLCGITIGLYGQNHDVFKAIGGAASILGLTSQICAKQYSHYSVLASDLIESIPLVMRSIDTMNIPA